MVEPLVTGLVSWPGWVGGFNHFDLGIKEVILETVVGFRLRIQRFQNQSIHGRNMIRILLVMI